MRVLHPVSSHRLEGSECPRCRYVSWAASTELDERRRGVLRSRSVEWRRLHVA